MFKWLRKLRVVKSLAYAATAYKTAYLSYHYPVEWAVACLNNLDKNEKRLATIKLARKRGIEILPVDINKSDYKFKVEVLEDNSKAIRFGFMGIKDTGQAGKLIEKLRSIHGEFNSFEDFLNKAHDNQRIKELLYDEETGKTKNNPLDKRSEQKLIQVGAFDELEDNRFALENYYMVDIKKTSTCTKEEKEKDAKKKKADQKLQSYYVVKDPDNLTDAAKNSMETELTGTYLTRNPLENYPYFDLSTISLEDGEKMTVETTGVVFKVTDKAKTGKPMLTIHLKDKNEMLFYAKAWSNMQQFADYKDFVKVNDRLIIIGTADSGTQKYKSIMIESLKKVVPESKLQATLKRDIKRFEKKEEERKKTFEEKLLDEYSFY